MANQYYNPYQSTLGASFGGYNPYSSNMSNYSNPFSYMGFNPFMSPFMGMGGMGGMFGGFNPYVSFMGGMSGGGMPNYGGIFGTGNASQPQGLTQLPTAPQPQSPSGSLSNFAAGAADPMTMPSDEKTVANPEIPSSAKPAFLNNPKFGQQFIKTGRFSPKMQAKLEDYGLSPSSFAGGLAPKDQRPDNFRDVNKGTRRGVVANIKSGALGPR